MKWFLVVVSLIHGPHAEIVASDPGRRVVEYLSEQACRSDIAAADQVGFTIICVGVRTR